MKERIIVLLQLARINLTFHRIWTHVNIAIHEPTVSWSAIHTLLRAQEEPAT